MPINATTPAALKDCRRLLRRLERKNDILLLTTSNRYEKEPWNIPKTTQLARHLERHLVSRGKRVTLLDITTLKIHDCEGNVSSSGGNNCGVLKARLQNKRKNPTGHLRCWASVNNKDDELYKVSNALFKSRVVIFFVSVRWGQTNGIYQRLFERLSWIENRVSSLGEKPIPQLKGLEAGLVLFGQNWNNKNVFETQKKNFEWFGWKTPAALSFFWQHTRNIGDESPDSYRDAIGEFKELLRALTAEERAPA